MSELTLCGVVRVVTSKYGDIFKIGFSEEHINILKENSNEAGWTNVQLIKKGKRYICHINNWKPDGNYKKKEEETEIKNEFPENDKEDNYMTDEDVPF